MKHALSRLWLVLRTMDWRASLKNRTTRAALVWLVAMLVTIWFPEADAGALLAWAVGALPADMAAVLPAPDTISAGGRTLLNAAFAVAVWWFRNRSKNPAGAPVADDPLRAEALYENTHRGLPGLTSTLDRSAADTVLEASFGRRM